MYLITDINCFNVVEANFQKSLETFYFACIFFQCMSMIEDMTKEMQDVRDEHKIQMDQIKGVSTNVPTDNKLEIYQQIWIMLKV